MVHIKSETETVIKKILPYLNRRGYDTVKDFDFETMSTLTDSYSKGFVDILVTLGKKNAAFLIEAKRISKKLTNKDRDQAISYARAKEIRVPFVVVTNGMSENGAFKFCDTTTTSGKDYRRGIHSLFEGIMAAYRNPAAHANLQYEKREAMEQIMLASQLMYVLDKPQL